MKRYLMIVVSLIGLVMPGIAIAYIERTDTVLSDKDNAVYVIGWVYNRLVGATIRPSDDKYRIYKIDLKDSSKTLLYEADKRTMDRLTLSPDNNYIAVTRGDTYPMKEILIIDKKLRMNEHSIAVPEGILAYAWSPDGKKIAYMTGQHGQAEMGQILSTGIWLYDLKRKEKKKVAASAESIEWLSSGDLALNIAYKEQKSIDNRHSLEVNKYKSALYDATTGKIKKETKGFHVSLDGRYSLDPKYIGYVPMTKEDEESTHMDFYDLKDDKVILSSSLTGIFTELTRILWGAFLWVKGNRVVIEKTIEGSVSRDIVVGDIEKNKVLKEVRGQIVGVNSDRSKLVIYSDGKFTAVDVP